ncbi:presenilin-associated rhomboid-like protein, mitochondrial [Lepeophtheirus salmonis]|uniref:rhomboid protease n=1 Tax=Lepeophtheirus salmonis TaxID=72036 RepID=A0A0K2ULA1_LEPSM|nr:presenilins-associated rhomboid-like protein, mitochondrial [Lepeophtheirus salmonis]
MWCCSTRTLSLLRHVRKDFSLIHNTKRSFRVKSLNINGGESGTGNSAGTLIKPFLFTLGFGATTLAAVSIWQYENIRGVFHSKTTIDIFNRKSQKYGELRREINHLWNQLSPGEKVFVPIFCLNLAVTLMWQIRRFEGSIMRRYFLSDPRSSNKCFPLFLSSFSHNSFLHFAVNMFVLHSFCDGIVRALGKEQFVGVYLTAGVVSGFVSLVTKVLLNTSAPSLGASGCICAVLGLFGTLNPNSLMQIVFIPGFTFTASTAIKGLITLDTAGLLMGWKVFDHAAHLGGTLFGIWWATYGGKLIWQKREKFITWWHENVRSK